MDQDLQPTDNGPDNEEDFDTSDMMAPEPTDNGPEEDFDMSDMMTPEEFEQYKLLEAKVKKQKKMAGAMKGKVFEQITSQFGSSLSALAKQQVTITTKDPYSDGQIYSITFGVEQDEVPDVDTKELTTNIIDEFLSMVEPIMGTSKSIVLSGTYEGKKLFWQIRKREK